MRAITGLTLIVVAITSIAVASGESGPSIYAGQEERAIKSLSAADVDELRRGGGWGMAKAAELNGLPGPAHLLELKDRIPLTKGQVVEIEVLFRDMREMAVAEGERLIALERELDRSVSARTITEASLADMLERIAQSRKRLRYIHLSTHLKTPEILSRKQIARYNRLRGYADDPCAKVPDGHDPAMWRQHNNCR